MVKTLLLSACLLFSTVFSFLFANDNDYTDKITGFSFTAPASFEFDRLAYPVVYEGKKDGKWRDYLTIDKIFKDIEVKDIEGLLKENIKGMEGYVIKDVRKQDVNGKEALKVYFSFKKKPLKDGEETKETSSVSLYIKAGRIIDVLTLEYRVMDVKEADALFDSVVGSIKYGQAEKSDYSFFNRKLPEIGRLFKINELIPAEALIDEELKTCPDEAGLLFAKGELLVRQKKEEEAVPYFRKAYEEGYAGLSEFFTGDDNAELTAFAGKHFMDGILKEKKALLLKGRAVLLAKLKKALPLYGEIGIKECNIIMLSDIKDPSALKILKESVFTAVRFAKEELGINVQPYPIIWVLSKDREVNKAMMGGLMGSSSGFAGVYDPSCGLFFTDKKTGYGVFVHEYMHALHFADQFAADQNHPIWLTEMLSTVFGELEMDDNYKIKVTVEKSARLPILAYAIKNKEAIPLKTLVEMKQKEAYNYNNINVFYATVRFLGVYLREEGLLKKFYLEYKNNQGKDRSGKEALEKVTGMKLDELQTKWEEWVNSISGN